MIYWDTFSWEAFVSGLAILVAGFVGFRQVGLQKRQSALEELALKSALWDRRMEIYDATAAYLGHIVLKGGVPGRTTAMSKAAGFGAPAAELAIDFDRAVQRSRLLLSPPAASRLADVQAKAMRLGDIREDSALMYGDNKEALQDEAQAIRASLITAYNDVSAIFGEDIRLTI